MKKLAKLMITLSAGLMLLTACSDGNSDARETLYFIPVVDIGAYWAPMRIGAEQTAQELGYNLVVKTSPPAQPDKNTMHIGFITEAVSNGAAGIAVAPIEQNMFRNPIVDAMNADIPVITFDGDLDDPNDRTAYVGTNNTEAGAELARNAVRVMKEAGITSGAISIVTVDRAMPTMIDREAGIRRAFDEEMGADASNFRWLETIQDNDQAAVSQQQLEAQITANDDLVVVFSLGSEGPDVGTMNAIESQGKAGQILHFGFDYTPTWEHGIEKGLISGIVDQDAFQIGVSVIENLVKVVNGESIPSVIPIDVRWVPASELVAYGQEKQALMGE